MALCRAWPAMGWGREGHHLAARIAEAELTPAARSRVAEILGPGQSLVSVSGWADEVRRTRPETVPWHYIDIPIDRPRLDLERDCPHRDCVVAKIEDFQRVLGDLAATPEKRREALMFLSHFVEDLHQPLHGADNKDRGGNELRVQFGDRQTNLHTLWDGLLLSRMGTEEQLLPALLRESAHHAGKWSKGTVEEWAEQSHKAAQKVVYGKLPHAPPTASPVIDSQYEQAADGVIREQIERAGARLARLLNETLR